VAYLPDFWLPSLQYWVEIKPASPLTAPETIKAQRLAAQSRVPVYVCCGLPHIATDPWQRLLPRESYSILAFAPDQPAPQSGYFWCWCPICKTAGITLGGEGSRLSCPCHKLPPLPTATHPRLRAASATACQARFEHGETPG